MKSKLLNFKLIFFAILLFALFGFAESSWAAVIVQDNFDAWSDFSCSTTPDCPDPPAPWSDIAANFTIAVSASNGRSGKGWKSSYPGGFTGSGINLSAIDPRDEIYIRFYMKFGSNFNMNWGNGMKIVRVMGAGGLDEELFRLELGNDYDGLYIIPDGNLNLYPRDFSGTTFTWAMYNNGINDNSAGGNVWRSVEFHGKFGASLGTDIADIWVDGTNILHATNVRLRNNTNSRVVHMNLGDNAESPIGDLYFDDFVVSASYIGPISSDTTPPAVPQGLSVQ